MRELVLFAACACMAGCQLAPRHERPDAPVASEYPQEYTGEAARGANPTQLGWQAFIADERLRHLIARALEENRDLQSVVAQVEQVRAAYRIERAAQLPSIGVNSEATRTRGVGIASLGTGTGVLLDEPYEIYSAGVGLSAFELDFWSRVRNLSSAARSRYLSTLQAARAFQLSLIRDVAFAYFASLEASERLDLAAATLDSRRRGLRIAERRRAAGVTSALEFYQAETLLTQAEIELAALHLTKAQNDNFLTVLIGGPVTTKLPPGLSLEQQVAVDTIDAGLPSALLTNRPDVLAAEESLRAARADIGAARAAFFPAISLTGSYGYASTELSDLFGEDGRTWSFGPAISLPIFDFGRRRANLDAAHAQARAAAADYERTVQTAFQEVADTLAGRRYLAEQVSAQERATVAQRRIAELAQTRYREGVVSYLEVLDAERNLFAAEQALLQVRRVQAANLISLYVALGGGLAQ